MSTARKRNEKIHGAAIASNAVDIWGWGTQSGRIRARRRADLLIRYGHIRENSAVLELGCGTGLFSDFISQTGASVTALDISWDLLIQAHRSNNRSISYILGDAEEYPLKENSFDTVVGSSVLHHLHPGKALAEAFRVLKPGGAIAFAEPNMLNPQIAIQKNIPYIKKRMGDSPDETAFNRWEASNLFRKTGFTDVHATPYDFLHPLVPPFFIPLVSRLGHWFEKLPLLSEIAGSLIIYGRKPHE